MFITYALMLYVPIEIIWPILRKRVKRDEWKKPLERVFRCFLVVCTFAIAIAIPHLGNRSDCRRRWLLNLISWVISYFSWPPSTKLFVLIGFFVLILVTRTIDGHQCLINFIHHKTALIFRSLHFVDRRLRFQQLGSYVPRIDRYVGSVAIALRALPLASHQKYTHFLVWIGRYVTWCIFFSEFSVFYL